MSVAFRWPGSALAGAPATADHGVDAAPRPQRRAPLPGGAGPRDVGDPLWWRHGSGSRAIHALGAAEPALRAPLCPHRPFLAAEAVHALRHDAVVRFADLLLRRLVALPGPCLEPDCLRAA